MFGVHMKWDTVANKQLAATLGRLSDTTRARLPNLIRQTTYYFVRSARKATPKMRAGRKRRIRVARKGETKTAKYVIEVWRQGLKQPRLIPTNNKQDKRANIRYGGAAQAGWLATFRALGKNELRQPAHIERVGRKANMTRFRLRGDSPYVLTANRIKYIQSIAPLSAALGIAKANNQLVKRYMPELMRVWKVEWERWK
jgi:hypothetical protein